ncbi:MAG: hypothetical protein IT426_16070 [Pirellulales bacterium]|nr:hypothetical protein [Pirellulales bacterium]
MPTPPRPSWLLIFNALVVIAACLVSFGYCAWILATKHGPILVLAAPLMLCVPLLIAAMQFRAVFRRSEIAARNLGKYLFIAGGLLAIFFAMLTGIYAANEKEADGQRIAILSAITVACVYLLYCGRANLRWAEQLEEGEKEP